MLKTKNSFILSILTHPLSIHTNIHIIPVSKDKNKKRKITQTPKVILAIRVYISRTYYNILYAYVCISIECRHVCVCVIGYSTCEQCKTEVYGLVKQCNVLPGAININTRTGYTVHYTIQYL
jgi:hypothetical protein